MREENGGDGTALTHRGKQSLGVAHVPSKVALREHIDAYIAHWNDDPTPFIWTKPAASIIRSRKRMLDRISHSAHTAPLAKTLRWEHVGSEAGRPRLKQGE